MLNLKDINWKKPGLFALRAKDSVMKTVTTVQENAGDVLAEAKQINEDRAAEAEAEVVDDFCETEETAEDTAEAPEE